MSKNKKQHREKSTIDIVIPVYSNFELTEKCITSIPDAMGDIKYKIYIVDDFSPDLEEKGKKFYQHLRINLPNLGGILQHNKNSGFPKSCNDGANLGSSELIMILSTDVLLTPNSMKIMVDHILGSPEVGIVFPKLLFFPNSNDPNRPSGKIQACGTVFDITLKPYHIYCGWDVDHPLANRVRDYNAMTGATFIIRRNIWFKLKGFDEHYGLGTYEDVDLALRTRMLDYKIRYLPQATAFHGVGLSASATKNPFPLNENYQYFKLKFGNKVPYDDFMY